MLSNPKIFIPATIQTGRVAKFVGAVPANPDFGHKFDPGIFGGIPRRPSRTVVVDQDPAPGDFAPAGTPIKVTVVEKSLIPVKSFNGLTAALTDKYQSIGALEDDLNNANDPVSKNAKAALDKGVPFDSLADADKQAVTTFVVSRLGSAVDATKAAQDVSFLAQL
jgi:hypothetical protein